MDVVNPIVLKAIKEVDIHRLARSSEHDLRPFLPCLVRMSLITPLDQSEECRLARRSVFQILCGTEVVNSIVGLLSVDFPTLETDLKKEHQLRLKQGVQLEDGVQNSVLEFERSEAKRKFRLVLSEILTVVAKTSDGKTDFEIKNVELFSTKAFLDEVSDVLCVAIAELPTLMPLSEVVEALMQIENGDWFIERIVANMPDVLLDVCYSLIRGGEAYEEETLAGRTRLNVLKRLAALEPKVALSLRSKCIELCRMPAFAVHLTLQYSPTDLVSFLLGLLLGSSKPIRDWLSAFIRTSEKRSEDARTFLKLREELISRMKWLSAGNRINEGNALQAVSLLRLYCAMKGIAGLKQFSDEELALLPSFIISRPPPTPAGLTLATISLSALLACPSLVSSEWEVKIIQYIRWLLREAKYFGEKSFTEVLILIAIYFHANQRNIMPRVNPTNPVTEIRLYCAYHAPERGKQIVTIRYYFEKAGTVSVVTFCEDGTEIRNIMPRVNPTNLVTEIRGYYAYHAPSVLSAITDFVCNTLAMRLTIRTSTLARMRTLFTQDILPEQVITSHATKVPITVGLNGSMTNHLPVNCIYQLLKSRSFTKHRVSIKPWVYRQIGACKAPLHPTMPLLIEQYITSMLTLTNKPGSPPTLEAVNAPLEESDICRIFHPSDAICKRGDVTPQLLLLYYILYYEDTRMQNVKAYLQLGLRVKVYERDFILDLPIRYLLLQAEKKQQSYPGLFPTLLRLLTSQFPQLCIVEDWIYEIEPTSAESPILHAKCDEASIRNAFKSIRSSPDKVSRILKQLSRAPLDELWSISSVFVENIQKVLEKDVPTCVQIMYKEVWFRIASSLPRRFWVQTTDALQPTDRRTGRHLTEHDLTMDPLITLRCDPRVFRCPPVLSIVLHLLRVWLASSRSCLQRHQIERPLLEKSGNLSSESERDDLRNAYVAAQESIVVQILLEACLEKELDKETGSFLSELQEARSVICSYLHQVFIADPSLCKLVHFQGYPREVIPIAVEGIPSIHICLDFIPELLAQPNLEKQIFGIDLVSHLCVQYALPKSFSIARLAINVVATLIPILQSEQRRQLLEPVLPSIVRIASVFPNLRDDIVDLYVQIGQITVSELSLSGALKFNPAPQFEPPTIIIKPEQQEDGKAVVKQEAMEVEEGEIDEEVKKVESGEVVEVKPAKRRYKKRNLISFSNDNLLIPLEEVALNDLYAFLTKQRESFAELVSNALLKDSEGISGMSK